MTLSCNVGINIGNGYTKAVSETAQVALPSYYRQISEGDINGYEAIDSGAVIEIVGSSTRPDLIDTKWLLGDTAKEYFPDAYGQVVDSLDGKQRYGLQLFLGAIALLGVENDASINALASIHDSQIFGKDLKKALDGTHTVKINGCRFTREINILSRVTEEGTGAILSGTYSPRGSIGLIDVGHGTTIASIFRGGKLMDGSRTVLPVGVHQLCDAIAKHPDTRRKLQRQGNLHLIREGLKSNFTYGTTGWEFSSIYASVLKDWVSGCLAPAFKHLQPRIDELQTIYLTGGGALLPNISAIATRHGLTTIQDPQMAEALGLQKVSGRIFTGVTTNG
jgi:Actin like proteins N terminal domain